MSTTNQPREPYVGPRPFDRSSRDLFFGRTREAHELLSLIYGHPSVLLYARSGVGKTSLVNAGLIPLLEPEAKVVASVRVSGRLPGAVVERDVKCIFALYARMSLEPKNLDFVRMNEEGLAPVLANCDGATSELDDEESIRVVFFDQFEELFTTAIDRWRDRERFFDEVRSALQAEPRLRVVFAMREEYVACMDRYARSLPGRLEARYRLDGLRRASAADAIRGPLQRVGRSLNAEVTDRFVTQLLRQPRVDEPGSEDFEGEYVEPLHIQLVGAQIWSKLKADDAVCSPDSADALIDLEAALRDHYDHSVREVSERSATLAGVHVPEARIRAWFEQKLITPNNMRSLVVRDVAKASGLPDAIVKSLEDDHHLLRSEARAGTYWTELAHDRLIGPVRHSNRLWLATHEAAVLVDGTLEARAIAWLRSDRQESHSLSDGELAEIDRLLASPVALEFGISDVVTEFRRAGIAARERRRARARRRSEILGFALFAISLVTAVVIDRLYDALRVKKAELHAKVAESQFAADRIQLSNELGAAKAEKQDVLQQLSDLRQEQRGPVQAQDPGLQQQISSLEAKRTKLEQDERSLDAQKRDLMRRIAVHTRDLSATDAENLSKLEARVGQMDATIEKLSDELRRCELGR